VGKNEANLYFFMLEGRLLQSCYFQFWKWLYVLTSTKNGEIFENKKKIGIQKLKEVEFISYKPQNQILPRKLNPNPNGPYPL